MQHAPFQHLNSIFLSSVTSLYSDPTIYLALLSFSYTPLSQVLHCQEGLVNGLIFALTDVLCYHEVLHHLFFISQ